MKTISSKDLHLQQAAVLKQVAAGDEYEVTFHRKPVAHIIPAVKHEKEFLPGSKQAALNSFKYSIQATGDLYNLSYKELRDQMMEEKYGPFNQ